MIYNIGGSGIQGLKPYPFNLGCFWQSRLVTGCTMRGGTSDNGRTAMLDLIDGALIEPIVIYDSRNIECIVCLQVSD